jgi:uncharacterized protein YidB (DUF937 family)
MSYLDVLGRALAGPLAGLETGSAPRQGLVGVVIQWLGTGGLAELAKGFQQAGLGDVLSSWIGKGANLPVSAEQLTKALGTARLASLAGRAGLTSESAAGQLATLLPGLVDELTPDGALPQGGALEQGLGLLKKLL